MPSTTAKGLPYPLPTDPVSHGADDIRLLAQAVDPLLDRPVPLFGGMKFGGTPGNIADGQWHHFADQDTNPALMLPTDLVGPGKRFKQWRVAVLVVVGSTNGCTDWNIQVGLGRPWIDTVPPINAGVMSLGAPAAYLATAADTGWLTLPSITASPTYNVFNVQYQFNTLGGNPTNISLGIAGWIV